MSGRAFALLSALAAACVVGAVPALADPIPAATYKGTAADGALVQFTVSSDGTLVDSYSISQIRADNCTFDGEGQKGIWEGAPVIAGAFQYQLYSAILFRGSFPGAQSATGEFRFFTPATSATKACDSGAVRFTATTTAKPPPPPGGGPTGGGSGGKSSGKGARKPTFATRLTFRKVSRARFGGRITSSSKACRAGATVILWRGPQRFASTHTKSSGTYWFPRRPKLHGQHVRASVVKRTLRTAVCTASTSKFITA